MKLAKSVSLNNLKKNSFGKKNNPDENVINYQNNFDENK
jgi:hypothetical protein